MVQPEIIQIDNAPVVSRASTSEAPATLATSSDHREVSARTLQTDAKC